MAKARHDARVWISALGAACLGLWSAVHESPWEDETFSLRAFDTMRGYRFMPVYFLWLRLGGWIEQSFLFLRIWSFLPFLPALFAAWHVVRRYGGSRDQAGWTVLLLGLNPYLITEAKSIRYYAAFFLVSMGALLAAERLARRPSSRLQYVGWAALLVLPTFVVYSGVLLLFPAVVWLLRPPAKGPSTRSTRLLPWAIAALGVAPWPIILRGPAKALIAALSNEGGTTLPIVVGFAKAPPDAWTLGHQASQLLGWSHLAWWVPSPWIEAASLGVVVSALAYSVHAHRGPGWAILLALASVPLFLLMMAPVLNLLCVRYYAFVALPVAFALIRLLFWLNTAGRHSDLRRALGSAILLTSAAAYVSGFWVTTESPVDELVSMIESRLIGELAVDPPWSADFIANALRIRGQAGSGVHPIGPPAEGQSLPDWIFRKDPRWTWLNPGKPPRPPPPDPAQYEEVRRFESLKRFDFHNDRVVDRLYRRR